MIWLTRVDGVPLLTNADHIVWVEAAHDTLVCLSTGERLRVAESAQDIARRIARWRREQSLAALLEPEAAEES